MSRGYTLIELTIVVGLVSILAIGISSVVLMNSVTAGRTRHTAHLRESGDYALTQLKQLVRNAKTITSCNSTTNRLQIVNLDGRSTLITLELDGSAGRIASNSGTYLTPADIDVEVFDLTCLPTDSDPSLVKFAFQTILTDFPSGRESPVVNFETSVNLRNN